MDDTGGACSTHAHVSLKGTDHSEDPGISGRTIFKRKSSNRVGCGGLASSGTGQGPATAMAMNLVVL